MPCFGKNRRYRQSAGDTGQVMWGLEDHGKDFVSLPSVMGGHWRVPSRALRFTEAPCVAEENRP